MNKHLSRSAFAAALLASSAALAASPLTYAPGTNGYGSSITLLTTGCNSIANASFCTLGSEVNNSSGQNAIYSDVVFTAGGSFTPTSPAYMSCWLLVAPDGTNYEDGNSTGPVTPGRPADFQINIRAASSITPVQAARQVVLPPGKFKALCQNNTGTTLPASGNTIIAYPFQLQQ